MSEPVIVLAGGLGTRLRAVTEDRFPKPMVPVPLDQGSVPFLEFPLAHLRGHGFREVVLCIGHLGDRIREHFGDGSGFGLGIEYDAAGAVLTGTRLRHALASKPTRGPRLVVCGDVFQSLDLPAFMAAFEQRSQWAMQLAVRADPGHVPANVSLDSDGTVLAYRSGGVEGERMALETGTLALRAEALEGFDGPSDFSITQDLYPQLIQRRILGAFESRADFFDIGTPADYRRFCAYARQGGVLPVSRMPR